ncbi:MAG: hypothetical protein HUK01_09615, partial [Bacteroidaceae bacterium]|nr:hypothetical protein [Bacteroidaceae bacterium]
MNKLRIWLTMLCALVGVSTWAVEFNPKDAYSIKSGSQYATTTEASDTNDGKFSTTYTVSATPESFVLNGNDTDGWTIKSISTNKWLGRKAGNSGWNVGNLEASWDIASTTGTTILRHGDTDSKGIKVGSNKMYHDGSGNALVAFDFTKTHQNVTVRFMSGSSSVGTADAWVALGATVEDVAKANVPEGYLLAGGTYDTVVEGTY